MLILLASSQAEGQQPHTVWAVATRSTVATVPCYYHGTWVAPSLPTSLGPCFSGRSFQITKKLGVQVPPVTEDTG